MTATMPETQVSASELSTALRAMYAQMNEWLEGTLGDATADQLHWQPTGRVVPAGAHYAHHVMGAEDIVLNMLVRGTTPLAMGEWQDKTGLSEPPPMGPWDEWARRVQIDMPALRAYAQAVYANMDAYLAAMTMDEWNRELDLSAFGMPPAPVSIWVTNMLLDGAVHCGEISAVKGLQGLQGYPF